MYETETLLTLAAVAAGSGIVGGILAGLLGVGGGIVIVPALYLALTLTGMDSALTMQVAVGTSLATITAAVMRPEPGHNCVYFVVLKLWALPKGCH